MSIEYEDKEKNLRYFSMLLVSTLFTCVLLSRAESKKPDKAVTELLSSPPPPADTGDRQQVSVKTKLEEQGPQWPVREMIAILGGYTCNMYTREHRLDGCRRSAGVLGRGGAHGDHIPISVGNTEMLQQTRQPREEGGEHNSYSK